MSRRILLFLSLLFLAVATSTPIRAATPICHSTPHNYCQYHGMVKSIYVNSGNIILLYFDTPLHINSASSVGFNVSFGEAAAIYINDNPEFANLFYSTALAAQASNQPVTIQMRGEHSGYLKIDRIWLSKQ
ncbi:hypothetical protein [Enterovibrio norvegicus]|uniref:hypothetical protein n=1 Tax=Enterovibrio norvegicus TaxID=188144 RepID=UPI0009F4D808|nr:hypothetical protein [Enterovibrio norvegicus]